MANTNAPKGFSPVRHINGSAWNEAANLYYIPSTDTSAYYIGDAVVSIANADTNGVPAIAKATAGATVRGVIVGFVPDPSNLTLLNVPATKTKGYYAHVVDASDTVFAIQDDGVTALTATDVGLNANFTVAAPTGISPLSATVLNTATPAITITLPLKILGLEQSQTNAFGAYARWLVVFNQHELMGNTVGV